MMIPSAPSAILHCGQVLGTRDKERRFSLTQAVYEGRVKTVLERLSAAGVKSDAVAVKDGLPGGDGISSTRVIVILKEKMSKSQSMTSGSATTSSSTSTSGSILR
jgi:hypothetical protein